MAFATTNVDDFLLLLGFFAESSYPPWQIVAGQFLGMAAIIGVSLAGAFAAMSVSGKDAAMLGIIPLLIGLGLLAHTTAGLAFIHFY